MNFLRQVWDEAVGLFIDDGMLALQVLVLVVGMGALVELFHFPALPGALLVGLGCLAILGFSLARKAKG